MNKNQLVNSIYDIACRNPHGFTVDTVNCEPITEGYAVACHYTQNSFGVAGLHKSVRYAKKNQLAVGGWHDEYTNVFHFDAVKIFAPIQNGLQRAINVARAEKQRAIYSLHEKKVIFI